MDFTPTTQIQTIFDLLKDGLKPYIFSRYQKEYGDNYILRINEVTRSFKRKDTDIEVFFENLDTQGVLDLILKQKNIFQDDLGYTGFSYASELLEYRNFLAHDVHLSQEDVIRVADTASRLLNRIGEVGISQQVYEIWEYKIRERYDASGKLEEKKLFTQQLINNLSSLNQTIEALTFDQFRIIEWLQGVKRATISGCAGSGKTLVAVEKAIRLSKAGFHVLLLCHSPLLAKYIRQIAGNLHIQIHDFYSWISYLIGNSNISDPKTWIHNEEPTDDELVAALDKTNNLHPKFDAVIVDEGQDFRESWWLLVDAALEDPQNGILYIFHDDNQALLPLRSKYPISDFPKPLSKNCRNAGKVYEVIRRFHSQAPETTILLKNFGYFRLYEFDGNEEINTIKSAIQESIELLEPSKWVILTTEFVHAEHSTINNMAIMERPTWSWQEAVLQYFPYGTFTQKHQLSKEPYPNKSDIRIVYEVADEIVIPGYSDAKTSKIFIEGYNHNPPKWVVTEDGLKLTRKGYALHSYAINEFFRSPKWAEGIPRPLEVKTLAHTQIVVRNRRTIPIFNVSSYKGLEAEGVILFIQSSRDDLASLVYVGASRAKAALVIVVSAEASSRLPQLS